MNTKNYSNLKPWKPRQSGNPAGRKPGSKNVSTIVRELLEQEIKNRMQEYEITEAEGVMTHERYKERAAKHTETLARAKQLLDGANTNAERWLELAKETFSSVINIGDVFDMANDQERRRLMMYIGSNWHLGNKKVVLIPREPLSLLRHNNSETNWRARPAFAKATASRPDYRFTTFRSSVRSQENASTFLASLTTRTGALRAVPVRIWIEDPSEFKNHP